MRRVVAVVGLAVTLASCTPAAQVPSPLSASPASATPVAQPSSSLKAIPAPSGPGTALQLLNLGVSVRLPAGWRVRTSSVDELSDGDVSSTLDTSALVALTAASSMELSSLGRTGLIAVRDDPTGWLDIAAYSGTRRRDAITDPAAMETPGGAATLGLVAPTDGPAKSAVAYVDVPAGDWDLALTARVEAGSDQSPMAILEPALASLAIVGAPASTGTELDAASLSRPMSDAVLEDWFPDTLGDAPATASSDSGRHIWLTSPAPLQDGTIYELCARLAATADDVSLLLGSVRPPGAEPTSVLGCRVAGATSRDWSAIIPMTPLEGWDRPVYATAMDGVVARWVVAGEVASIVLGLDETLVEAVARDLPADLLPIP